MTETAKKRDANHADRQRRYRERQELEKLAADKPPGREANVPHQRALVAIRQEAAERHGVAVGWINSDGELLDGAILLERPKVA